MRALVNPGPGHAGSLKGVPACACIGEPGTWPCWVSEGGFRRVRALVNPGPGYAGSLKGVPACACIGEPGTLPCWDSEGGSGVCVHW